MSYKKIDDQIISEFSSFLDEKQIITIESEKLIYAKDKTEDFVYMPELVLIPANTEEVSRILKICNEHLIPVTVRSTGTGLSGGALPVKGGIVISMEKFNKILNIDTDNFQITTEPFVINYILQQAVKEKGLFYPPDPANYKDCSIGGNISENSGGPKAVKYGTTKDYVLSLEVVLANGDIINTGRNLIKDVAGYNLTQLFVGSEGTLGVITKATLKLLPEIKENVLMLMSFTTVEDAGRAVNTILNTGIIPSSLEFMERNALIISKEHINAEFPPVSEKTQAHLIVELDGNDYEKLLEEREILKTAVEKADNPEFILFANSEEEKEQIWTLRRNTGTAVGDKDVYKEQDISIPRANIPKAVNFINNWCQKYGYTAACYGHAGDGNIHANILRSGVSDDIWNNKLKVHLKELFDYICNTLNGSVTGEHGIGFVQREYLPVMIDETTLNIMKSIKNLLDPNNIINPGKIFLD
ncbi:FAD-binding oxidoreductase [Sebaldella sp. S0638]|uniref:FAD-binding oxidoreductase n=1 Tax=Sebaldella sp. S0638 TaxID=2957809 RepID=UPI00209E1F97|nr:FAD-linked oxidase C-terminal domain-containing protein [Sebaldella sp. S0638]MCP1224936.1 FAD-binding protein [Sebaldella sp. S0638]